MRVRGRPANILLDEQLNAFLGDTGFAKAAQKSGDRRGATTSVWGGAGSQGYTARMRYELQMRRRRPTPWG